METLDLCDIYFVKIQPAPIITQGLFLPRFGVDGTPSPLPPPPRNHSLLASCYSWGDLCGLQDDPFTPRPHIGEFFFFYLGEHQISYIVSFFNCFKLKDGVYILMGEYSSSKNVLQAQTFRLEVGVVTQHKQYREPMCIDFSFGEG